MNNNDWGLTAQGFRRPSYTEILDAFEYQAKERLTTNGKTPNLTVRSILGIFIRIWAWITNLLFQVLEDVYNSQFVDTAVGTSLYQLGRNIGIRLLPSQRSSGYIEVIGAPGVTVPAGWLVGTVAGIQYTVQTEGIIEADGSVVVPIRCNEYGIIGNVDANTIREIINPLEGIESITNPTPTDGGRSRETDEEFRDRYYNSVDFAGGVSADAVQAEIRQKVEGILAAKVYENDTDITDSRGLPPHSLEAVVYSGLDGDVGKAIFRRKAGGIQTYGSTTVEITSEQNGQIYRISFTRPTAKPIWLNILNLSVDIFFFPVDGITQIENAILEYIGSDITGGLNIDEDVIYNKLPCRIYSIPGVTDFDLTISADGAAFNRNNIMIDEREKAVTDSDKIIIELAP